MPIGGDLQQLVEERIVDALALAFESAPPELVAGNATHVCRARANIRSSLRLHQLPLRSKPVKGLTIRQVTAFA